MNKAVLKKQLQPTGGFENKRGFGNKREYALIGEFANNGGFANEDEFKNKLGSANKCLYSIVNMNSRINLDIHSFRWIRK